MAIHHGCKMMMTSAAKCSILGIPAECAKPAAMTSAPPTWVHSRGHSFKFGSPTKRAGPLYSHPLDFLTKFYGVPLGLARAAIGQFRETMQTKVELPSQRPYKNTSRVQTAIGEAEMMLGAAHAYPYFALERHWRRLDAREPMTEKDARSCAVASQFGAGRASDYPLALRPHRQRDIRGTRTFDRRLWLPSSRLEPR